MLRVIEEWEVRQPKILPTEECTMALTKEERRFLDWSVRSHESWSCRHHKLIGWIGVVVFLGGLAASLSFGLDTYCEVHLRSDQSPPLVAGIPELLVPAGIVLVFDSALRMTMRIIGELHAELQRTSRLLDPDAKSR